ncbi:/ / hypothetical protein / 102872:103060 Forward [Candidatus Hepatoplasma crinochetorum]|uniref:DUF4044 domain-containing protein n=1 Tax=Candidatus Hepatoplasma crinochetorum TaxID=295596 RepID=A0A0G7ZM25_9MOLU|nr:/ / hypothetical protein / 102872:103060 Forward [Candidatus Hepatoplasma crinochetorum]
MENKKNNGDVKKIKIDKNEQDKHKNHQFTEAEKKERKRFIFWGLVIIIGLAIILTTISEAIYLI